MALRINDGLRSYIVDSGVVGAIGTAGVLKIYEGTQPGTAGDAATGNLIVEISGISWNAATNGTAGITATKSGTAGTDGTAGWGRLSGTDGSTYILDGDCGTATTNVFQVDSVAILEDAEVTLVSASIIQPAA